MRYSKKLATVQPSGFVIKKKELAPGVVTIASITPAETGVQLFTDITIKFTTEHTMY